MPHLIRTRRNARFFILLLWAACVLAIVGVVMQNPSSSESPVVEASLFAPADSRDVHVDHREMQRRYPLHTPVPMGADDVAPTDAPFLVFAGKTAFIEHFKYQYPEAELRDALQKALKNRSTGALNDTIEVEKLSPSEGRKFDKRYRVKVRFRVGAVPE